MAIMDQGGVAKHGLSGLMGALMTKGAASVDKKLLFMGMKFALLLTLCLMSVSANSRTDYTRLIIIPTALYVPYDDPPTQGGIALTFDDFDIASWYGARHIFNRYDAKVTFFMSYPDLLQGEEDGAMMRTLVNDGHELAAHGYQHDSVNQVESMDIYFEEAIYPHTQSVIATGYKKPISFAYPYGAFTEESDIRLLEYYRFLRRYGGSSDRAFYSSTSSAHSLGCIAVDELFQTVEEVIGSIELAHVRNEILILAAHRIIVNWEDRVSDYTITQAKLDAILKAAHDRGMRFYTIGRLPEYDAKKNI